MSKPITGGRYLSQIAQRDPMLATVLQNIIDTSNKTAQQSIGNTNPPTAPDSVNVKMTGEMAHVSITHNASINRGIQYLTEVSNSSSFSSPIVVDHGSSRTSHPFPLPTMDDQGNQQTYYFRSLAQYPGSGPSEKTVYGNASGPIGLKPTGTTKMTLLPSGGSGTASPDGGQGGQGLGVFPTRGPQGPKRKVSQ